MTRKPRAPTTISVEALRHDRATRRNNPTMELQSFLGDEEAEPVKLSSTDASIPTRIHNSMPETQTSIPSCLGTH